MRVAKEDANTNISDSLTKLMSYSRKYELMGKCQYDGPGGRQQQSFVATSWCPRRPYLKQGFIIRYADFVLEFLRGFCVGLR